MLINEILQWIVIGCLLTITITSTSYISKLKKLIDKILGHVETNQDCISQLTTYMRRLVNVVGVIAGVDKEEKDE